MELGNSAAAAIFPQSKNAPDLYSYAVVDGSTICISSLEQAIGTYTFDTVSRKWSQATHWALPFFGSAEHVPELGLWFGFPNDDWQTRGWDRGLQPKKSIDPSPKSPLTPAQQQTS